MSERLQNLRCKEVVNVRDGQRLGFVSDVEVDTVTGRICSLVVPGPCKFLGLVGRKDDFVIPWNCICRIGPDIILVELDLKCCRVPREKKRWD